MEAVPRICSFESRRADEMRSLIERHGGIALTAPSMREVAIEDNPAALQFIQECIADQFPVVILMTGVGTEALFDVARAHQCYEPLLEALGRSLVVIRGPKPAAVLSRVGLRYQLRAPEPNTWRELLQALDAAAASNPEQYLLRGKRVAVQEYGAPSLALYAELERRGALVTSVPVYRWALPEDTGPLEHAIREICDGRIDVILFTSAQQVHNVLDVAERLQLQSAFLKACERTAVGSIGPTCSETLSEHRLRVSFEASPPKMGQLVRQAMDFSRAAPEKS